MIAHSGLAVNLNLILWMDVPLELHTVCDTKFELRIYSIPKHALIFNLFYYRTAGWKQLVSRIRSPRKYFWARKIPNPVNPSLLTRRGWEGVKKFWNVKDRRNLSFAVCFFFNL